MIRAGNIANSQPVGIGHGAIAPVFQQVLLPAPSDYRYAALRLIEEYEEIFGGREAELDTLDAFLLRDNSLVCHSWLPPVAAKPHFC